MTTKLVVPPMPTVEEWIYNEQDESFTPDYGPIEAWGKEVTAIARREAALAGELAEALKRAKKMLGPHSLNPDAEGYLMVECALDRFAKHKEARNGRA